MAKYVYTATEPRIYHMLGSVEQYTTIEADEAPDFRWAPVEGTAGEQLTVAFDAPDEKKE